MMDVFLEVCGDRGNFVVTICALPALIPGNEDFSLDAQVRLNKTNSVFYVYTFSSRQLTELVVSSCFCLTKR